jgi:hypothetical protein
MQLGATGVHYPAHPFVCRPTLSCEQLANDRAARLRGGYFTAPLDALYEIVTT